MARRPRLNFDRQVNTLLNAVATSGNTNSLNTFMNAIPGALVEQEKLRTEREDRLQVIADNKAFQNRQFEFTKENANKNIDFNVLNSILGIEDINAQKQALAVYKSKTTDGEQYKSTLVASNESKNTSITNFNNSYEVYKTNKGEKNFEQNEAALNELILSADSNPTLNVFSSQLEKEKQTLLRNETKSRIGTWADGFSLEGATEEQNKQLRTSLKQVSDWETAKNIIEISSSQLKKPMTPEQYNLLLDNVREGVEEGLISPEAGEKMTNDLIQKINTQYFAENDNKKDLKIPKDVKFVKERKVDGINYSLYKKTENGQNKYYFINTSGFGEQSLQEMTEADFNAAMGVVEQSQEDASQAGLGGGGVDSPLNPNNPLSGVNASVSRLPGVNVVG